MKCFLLRLRTRQDDSILLFNNALEVPASAIRQEKEIKNTEIGKQEIKLFTNSIICRKSTGIYKKSY